MLLLAGMVDHDTGLRQVVLFSASPAVHTKCDITAGGQPGECIDWGLQADTAAVRNLAELVAAVVMGEERFQLPRERDAIVNRFEVVLRRGCEYGKMWMLSLHEAERVAAGLTQ